MAIYIVILAANVFMVGKIWGRKENLDLAQEANATSDKCIATLKGAAEEAKEAYQGLALCQAEVSAERAKRIAFMQDETAYLERMTREVNALRTGCTWR